jgi:hypothetical protein
MSIPKRPAVYYRSIINIKNPDSGLLVPKRDFRQDNQTSIVSVAVQHKPLIKRSEVRNNYNIERVRDGSRTRDMVVSKTI